MRRVMALAIVVSLATPAASVFAAPRAQSAAQTAGSITGRATSSNGRAMANASVRVRNLADGQVAGSTTTNAAGQFSFAALPAGNYSIEMVNAAGEVIGSSASVTLAAGAVVSGIAVSQLGAAAAVVAASRVGGAFFTSTAGIITIIAAGAGVAAVTVAATSGTASPSK